MEETVRYSIRQCLYQSIGIEAKDFIAIFQLKDANGAITTARDDVRVLDRYHTGDTARVRSHETRLRTFARPADVPDRSTRRAHDAHVEDVIERSTDDAIVELKLVLYGQTIVPATTDKDARLQTIDDDHHSRFVCVRRSEIGFETLRAPQPQTSTSRARNQPMFNRSHVANLIRIRFPMQQTCVRPCTPARDEAAVGCAEHHARVGDQVGTRSDLARLLRVLADRGWY